MSDTDSEPRCDCCEGPGPLRVTEDGEAAICKSCVIALTAPSDGAP